MVSYESRYVHIYIYVNEGNIHTDTQTETCKNTHLQTNLNNIIFANKKKQKKTDSKIEKKYTDTLTHLGDNTTNQ